MNIQSNLERQINKLRDPFVAFISAQTTASGFLLIVLLAALILANSPWVEAYERLQHFHIGLIIGDERISWPLLHFVNDGLIAVFFFLIGLEVKRELLAGELQEKTRVRLLISGALGGMLMPALLYLLINVGVADGEPRGWGIPMATDTAMAIGVLAALGAHAPKSVIAFLVGLAIIDDIGAILIIALFYTNQLAVAPLSVAALLLVAMMCINWAGLRHPLFYILTSVALWVTIVQSGVHASTAGVIAAATVPARPRMKPKILKHHVGKAISEVPTDASSQEVLGEAYTHRRIAEVERVTKAGTTPLRRWEDGLELPVALFILPLFAFLNAGIPITGSVLVNAFSDPIALGVFFGLVIGKPVGIVVGVWLGERLGGAQRALELSNRRLLGVGLLAGVGFTMSTFIANLALGQSMAHLTAVKLAIVMASFVAAMVGYFTLRFASDAD